jgi:hypothetical protein
MCLQCVSPLKLKDYYTYTILPTVYVGLFSLLLTAICSSFRAQFLVLLALSNNYEKLV